MLGYLFAALGGFLFGVVITCILLAQKNLERYQQISQKTEGSLKQNIAVAKRAYKAYAKEIDGADAESSASAETASDAQQPEEQTGDEV